MALGTQLHAVHRRQLWPPDPVQLISYLHVHYLYRAWKGYSSSPLFSLSTLSVLIFWTHVMSSATLMLQTDKEAEEVIKVDILGGFCLLVGVIVQQRSVLPVTASWLYVLVPGGVLKSVCQRPTCGRTSASFAYTMYTQLF